MPYGKYAECPCCGKQAHGEDEIEEIFGYRNMGDGRTIPQSYCKAGEPCKARGDKIL